MVPSISYSLICTEARDLISSILVYEPKERPSVKQILSHPWFSKVVLPTSFSDQAISVEPLPASIPEEHDQLYSPETYEPQTPLPYHSLSSSAIDSEPSYFSNTAPGSLALTNESVTPLTSEAGTSNTTTSQSTARQVSQHRPTASTSSLYTKPRIPVASTSGTTSPRASIDDEIGTPFRFPRAPPVATPISRSSSSGLGSPAIPMTIHSRTPSRTKRRSVGSNFSERLLLPLHLQSTINYLALLDRTETAPLTQPLDSRLLDNLSAVGFDTAQITHSVKTDACDCSSAMWWQLRKKTEEKEEAEREAGLRSPVSPADSLRTRRAKQSSESGVSMTPSRPTISQYTYEPPTPEARARANSSPEPSPRRRESERRSSKDIASSPFSSSATPFVSAPSLSYPLHSRSSEDLIDRDAIQTTPRKRDEPATPPTTYGLAASTPPSSHTINASTPSPSRSLEPDAKGKGKPRSASVSMLQRATSAFSKSDKLPTPESTDSGRSTPLAGFFRKSTNASESRPSLIEKLSKDRLRDHWSPPPASISKPLPSDDSHEYNQSPSSPPVESADESLLMSSTTSHDTHNSASTAASTTEDLSSPKLGENKPRNRGSLFSNFKLWFNEDRRKRKRQTTLAGFEGSSVAKLRVASPTTPAHRRQMSAFTESPLRGPSSRRSSTGAPTLPTSRRSSIKSPRHLSSAERLTQAHGQGRRRSVSSRTSFDRPNPGDMTPSSDRGHHSRPVSMISADLSDHLASSDIQLVRSSSSGGQQRQSRHKKASSFGSAASHRSNRDSSSPAPPFRRPPTSTTQVRRVTKGHARPPPHRRNSNASHQSASSRRSSLSDLDSNASPMIGIDHEVILEDEETENADIERAKALRKLSGDAGSIQPDKQHSRHSTDGSQGSIGRTVFTAHKSSSAFSSPAVTGATHHSRASSSTIRPKFRDVFANKTSQEDSEWVDEDDPLDGLGCGFGQNTLFTAGASPTDGDMFPGGSILGSGRYAGVNEAFFGGRSESKQGGQPRPVGLGLRSGTVIEEEEEEE